MGKITRTGIRTGEAPDTKIIARAVNLKEREADADNQFFPHIKTLTLKRSTINTNINVWNST